MNINQEFVFHKPDINGILGYDNFGRNIFYMLLEGTKNSLFIVIISIVISMVIGVSIGVFSGYIGKKIDFLIIRIIDIIQIFPSILFALIIKSILEDTSFLGLIITLSIVFLPSFVRVSRSETLKIKELDYIKTLEMFGESKLNIIKDGIIPNLKTTIITTFLVAFNNGIIVESTLSYLGLGTVNNITLGYMIKEGQTYINIIPLYAISPCLVIVGIIFFITKRIKK